jgi:hypothetical protein
VGSGGGAGRAMIGAVAGGGNTADVSAGCTLPAAVPGAGSGDSVTSGATLARLGTGAGAGRSTGLTAAAPRSGREERAIPPIADCRPGFATLPSATAINASATTTPTALTMNETERRRRRLRSPCCTAVLPLRPESPVTCPGAFSSRRQATLSGVRDVAVRDPPSPGVRGDRGSGSDGRFRKHRADAE